MCYSALVKRQQEQLERQYGAAFEPKDENDYLHASTNDPRSFPPLAERIYPGYFAPVIAMEGATLTSRFMRYGAYPPVHITHPSRYTTFNARRDNLTSSFWSAAFGQHHGYVVLRSFYEWVEVKDLLASGVVTLADVKAEFAEAADARRKKLEAQGKKWKPTPTELKEPQLRKIIIEFRPESGEDLLVPVIFSYKPEGQGKFTAGFAIVTDDPPREISAAGHDRCPLFLQQDALARWLQPQQQSVAVLKELLSHKPQAHFMHRLPVSA